METKKNDIIFHLKRFCLILQTKVRKLSANYKQNITMSKKETETPILADEMLGKSEAFVIKHKNVILGTILAVFLLVAGSMAYSTNFVQPKEEAADKAIFQAEHMFIEGNYEAALNGDGVNPGFLKIMEEHSGTNAANIASAYAGLCQARLGNYDEAIVLLEDFDGDDRVVAPKVKHALGTCYAHKENWEKAISLVLEAAEEGDNIAITPECWRDAAAMYEKIGKKDKALELYNRIKTEYPDAPTVNIEQMINSVN